MSSLPFTSSGSLVNASDVQQAFSFLLRGENSGSSQTDVDEAFYSFLFQRTQSMDQSRRLVYAGALFEKVSRQYGVTIPKQRIQPCLQWLSALPFGGQPAQTNHTPPSSNSSYSGQSAFPLASSTGQVRASLPSNSEVRVGPFLSQLNQHLMQNNQPQMQNNQFLTQNNQSVMHDMAHFSQWHVQQLTQSHQQHLQTHQETNRQHRQDMLRTNQQHRQDMQETNQQQRQDMQETNRQHRQDMHWTNQQHRQDMLQFFQTHASFSQHLIETLQKSHSVPQRPPSAVAVRNRSSNRSSQQEPLDRFVLQGGGSTEGSNAVVQMEESLQSDPGSAGGEDGSQPPDRSCSTSQSRRPWTQIDPDSLERVLHSNSDPGDVADSVTDPSAVCTCGRCELRYERKGEYTKFTCSCPGCKYAVRAYRANSPKNQFVNTVEWNNYDHVCNRVPTEVTVPFTEAMKETVKQLLEQRADTSRRVIRDAVLLHVGDSMIMGLRQRAHLMSRLHNYTDNLRKKIRESSGGWTSLTNFDAVQNFVAGNSVESYLPPIFQSEVRRFESIEALRQRFNSRGTVPDVDTAFFLPITREHVTSVPESIEMTPERVGKLTSSFLILSTAFVYNAVTYIQNPQQLYTQRCDESYKFANGQVAYLIGGDNIDFPFSARDNHGSHSLRRSFRPFLLIVSSTTGAEIIWVALKALNDLMFRLTGSLLRCDYYCLDGSGALRSAYKLCYPEAVLLPCYPHILFLLKDTWKRDFRLGKLYGIVKRDLASLRRCMSTAAFQLLWKYVKSSWLGLRADFPNSKIQEFVVFFEKNYVGPGTASWCYGICGPQGQINSNNPLESFIGKSKGSQRLGVLSVIPLNTDIEYFVNLHLPELVRRLGSLNALGIHHFENFNGAGYFPIPRVMMFGAALLGEDEDSNTHKPVGRDDVTLVNDPSCLGKEDWDHRLAKHNAARLGYSHWERRDPETGATDNVSWEGKEDVLEALNGLHLVQQVSELDNPELRQKMLLVLPFFCGCHESQVFGFCAALIKVLNDRGELWPALFERLNTFFRRGPGKMYLGVRVRKLRITYIRSLSPDYPMYQYFGLTLQKVTEAHPIVQAVLNMPYHVAKELRMYCRKIAVDESFFPDSQRRKLYHEEEIGLAVRGTWVGQLLVALREQLARDLVPATTVLGGGGDDGTEADDWSPPDLSSTATEALPSDHSEQWDPNSRPPVPARDLIMTSFGGVDSSLSVDRSRQHPSESLTQRPRHYQPPVLVGNPGASVEEDDPDEEPYEKPCENGGGPDFGACVVADDLANVVPITSEARASHPVLDCLLDPNHPSLCVPWLVTHCAVDTPLSRCFSCLLLAVESVSQGPQEEDAANTPCPKMWNVNRVRSIVERASQLCQTVHFQDLGVGGEGVAVEDVKKACDRYNGSDPGEDSTIRVRDVTRSVKVFRLTPDIVSFDYDALFFSMKHASVTPRNKLAQFLLQMDKSLVATSGVIVIGEEVVAFARGHKSPINSDGPDRQGTRETYRYCVMDLSPLEVSSIVPMPVGNIGDVFSPWRTHSGDRGCTRLIFSSVLQLWSWLQRRIAFQVATDPLWHDLSVEIHVMEPTRATSHVVANFEGGTEDEMGVGLLEVPSDSLEAAIRERERPWDVGRPGVEQRLEGEANAGSSDTGPASEHPGGNAVAGQAALDAGAAERRDVEAAAGGSESPPTAQHVEGGARMDDDAVETESDVQQSSPQYTEAGESDDRTSSFTSSYVRLTNRNMLLLVENSLLDPVNLRSCQPFLVPGTSQAEMNQDGSGPFGTCVLLSNVFARSFAGVFSLLRYDMTTLHGIKRVIELMKANGTRLHILMNKLRYDDGTMDPDEVKAVLDETYPRNPNSARDFYTISRQWSMEADQTGVRPVLSYTVFGTEGPQSNSLQVDPILLPQPRNARSRIPVATFLDRVDQLPSGLYKVSGTIMWRGHMVSFCRPERDVYEVVETLPVQIDEILPVTARGGDLFRRWRTTRPEGGTTSCTLLHLRGWEALFRFVERRLGLEARKKPLSGREQLEIEVLASRVPQPEDPRRLGITARGLVGLTPFDPGHERVLLTERLMRYPLFVPAPDGSRVPVQDDSDANVSAEDGSRRGVRVPQTTETPVRAGTECTEGSISEGQDTPSAAPQAEAAHEMDLETAVGAYTTDCTTPVTGAREETNLEASPSHSHSGSTPPRRTGGTKRKAGSRGEEWVGSTRMLRQTTRSINENRPSTPLPLPGYTEAHRTSSGWFRTEEQRRQDDRMVASLLDRLRDDRTFTEHQRKIWRKILKFQSTAAIGATVGKDSITRANLVDLAHPNARVKLVKDDVIHAYFFLLKQLDQKMCEMEPGSRRRSHYFSSSFMVKLLQYDPDPNKRYGDPDYCYANVSSWSRNSVPGGNIFLLDALYIPINICDIHWTLVIVRMRERTIQYYDSSWGDGESYLQLVLRYLQDEHATLVDDRFLQRQPPFESMKWRLVKCVESETPKQTNHYDCGVNVMMNAHFSTLRLPLKFQETDMVMARKHIAISIKEGKLSLPVPEPTVFPQP